MSIIATTVAVPYCMDRKEAEAFMASLDLVGLAKSASEIEIVDDRSLRGREVNVRFSVRYDEHPAIVLTRSPAKKRGGKR